MMARGPIQVRLLSRRGQEAHDPRTLSRAGCHPGRCGARRSLSVQQLNRGHAAGGGQRLGRHGVPDADHRVLVPCCRLVCTTSKRSQRGVRASVFTHLSPAMRSKRPGTDEGVNETFSGQGWSGCSAQHGRSTCRNCVCRSGIAAGWPIGDVAALALATLSYRLAPSHYGAIVYTHTAVFPYMLEGLIGRERLRQRSPALRRALALCHPGRRLCLVDQRGRGRIWGWYFSQARHGPRRRLRGERSQERAL